MNMTNEEYNEYIKRKQPRSPLGKIKVFSGDTEGQVLRYPPSSMRKSRKNSAASLIMGKLSRRKSTSFVYS